MSSLYERDLELLVEHSRIIGIDEAGRGSWAGPVVVAACILDYDFPIVGLNDSKKLGYSRRAELYDRIVLSCVSYKIVEITADYIDKHNILRATMLGMIQAADALTLGHCLIDGNQIPKGFPYPAQAVVRGDATHACIAAASILAKVHRDRLMEKLHLSYPRYRFDLHRGYGTKLHLSALQEHGACKEHRMSYKPLQSLETAVADHAVQNDQ
ncbi:MAG: ribonuclease HII [Candidatus Cloacimonadaceae bacterium]|nr:ribonuclease HII [Candidatus Cloacimonadaceae bacterium]MDP3114907.1 ribonuclease HII [Candidatus Cloacimonadaceae bacterium]